MTSIDTYRKTVQQAMYEAQQYFTYCQAYDFSTLEPYFIKATAATLLESENPADFETALAEVESAKQRIVQVRSREEIRIEIWPAGKAIPTITTYDINDRYYRDNPDFRPFMMRYDVPNGQAVLGTLLIGGGGGRNNMQEGHYYATWFSQRGYVCFVMNYRLAPWSAAESAVDIQRAIRVVRSMADRYGYDPMKIALVGNSASSMNSANVNNYFYGDVQPTILDPSYICDEIDLIDSSVNAQIHTAGVFKELVNPHYPPTFMVMGCDDFSFADFYSGANLLLKNGIPCEVHTFTGVPHAFNLGYDTYSGATYSNIAWWPELALRWLPHAFAFHHETTNFPKNGTMGRPGGGRPATKEVPPHAHSLPRK